jgi:hypothetical protein
MSSAVATCGPTLVGLDTQPANSGNAAAIQSILVGIEFFMFVFSFGNLLECAPLPPNLQRIK